MPINIAINGFGRIGRSIVRALFENNSQDNINLIAINEIASLEGMAHLLKYDSNHGRFKGNVNKITSPNKERLVINNHEVNISHAAAIDELPWQQLPIDILLDCTGIFSHYENAQQYLDLGVKRVLFSHPADNHIDATVIYGINHQTLTSKDILVSNGSCTTNCIIPVIKTLEDSFGVESGTITTIHSSMHDQQVIDAYHDDLRRTRAASRSIIPVDTKLAVGIERILPQFSGRFEAISVRVPTINVTAMDLSVTVNQDVTIDDINRAMIKAQNSTLSGILSYTEEPLVSVDFNHDPHSCIVDGNQTRVSHKRLIKMLVWCDNEWGFANRMLDTTQAIAKTINPI